MRAKDFCKHFLDGAVLTVECDAFWLSADSEVLARTIRIFLPFWLQKVRTGTNTITTPSYTDDTGGGFINSMVIAAHTWPACDMEKGSTPRLRVRSYSPFEPAASAASSEVVSKIRPQNCRRWS